MLVATYEGEHTHKAPGADSSSPPASGCAAASLSDEPAMSAAVNVDLTLSGTSPERKRPQSFPEMALPRKEKKTGDDKHDDGSGERRTDGAAAFFGGACRSLEDYMSSLMRDPGFTSALAGALARSFLLPPRPTSG